MSKPSIFISYSHKDEAWKDEVVTQLNVLSIEGAFDLWDDRQIHAGEDWYPAIEKAINDADASILLVSPDFLTSKFIINEEIPKLLERRDREGVHVLPLILRPCQWTRVKRIGAIQARPKDGKPLSTMRKPDREMALSIFVGEVADIVSAHIESGKEPPPVAAEQGFKLPPNMPTVINWVGRADELRDLKAKILNPDTRAIEITATAIGVIGSAGIGKTMLASKLLNELYDANAPFAAAAWASMRSDLETNKPLSFHTVTNSILFTLSNGKITTATTARDNYHKKTDRILAILKEKPCLMVFDNVESVLYTKESYHAGYFDSAYYDYAHLFKSIVEIEHKSKIIFTSRESLIELSRLVYSPVKLEGLLPYDAIELLKQFDLTASDEELEQLSDCYKGNPKALLLIASLIDEIYHGQASLFLQNQTCILTGDIDHLLDEVFARMSSEELECLCRISIYQTDRCPLDIKGISAQMAKIDKYEIEQHIVRALGRRQMLDYDIIRRTYYLHPYVQEKAYRQLKGKARDHKTAHERAYNYFIKTPLKPESEWQGVNDVMPRIMANYHASQLGKWNDAALAVEFLIHFLYQWSEFRLMLELLLPLIPDDWKEGNRKLTSEKLHGVILRNLGEGYYRLSNFHKAREFHMVALSAAKKVKDMFGEARTLINLGHVFYNLGGYQEAIDFSYQSLEISRKTNNRMSESDALITLGLVFWKLGDYQQALDYYYQSLDITRDINDRLGESSVLTNVGNVYSNLGEYQRAIDYYCRSVEIKKRIGDRMNEGITLENLCVAYSRMGNQVKAMECFSKSLLICREIGDKSTEGYLLNNKGLIHQALGDYTSALHYCQQALLIAREIREKSLEGRVLYQMGILLIKLKRYSEALEKLGQAKKVALKTGEKRTVGGTYCALAEVYQEMGEKKFQEEYCSKAAKIAEEIGIGVELLARI